MVRRHISDELKEMALSMSFQGLSDPEIRDFTGISERSLSRMRSTYRDTGAVSRTPLQAGRFRMLTSMEAKVRHTISQVRRSSYTILLFLSSFVTVSSVSPTWPSKSCRQRFEKSLTSKPHCRQLHAPSKRLAIP